MTKYWKSFGVAVIRDRCTVPSFSRHEGPSDLRVDPWFSSRSQFAAASAVRSPPVLVGWDFDVNVVYSCGLDLPGIELIYIVVVWLACVHACSLTTGMSITA